MSASLEQIRQHWKERAALGETAGTQDLGLKALERDVILGEIAVDMPLTTLEVGCGHGETANEVAYCREMCQVTAIDNAEDMVDAARRQMWSSVANVRFVLGDVLDPPPGPFDLVYSQRCLINLPTWDLQKQAIDAIAGRLVSGGRFLMCEHSAEGLNALNVERYRRGLKTIVAPWHNRYLQDAELDTITSLTLLRCVPFSASYYFHSRVLNAIYADAHGQEPAYDATINRLDAPCAPRFAQARLWVWEKP